MSQPGGPSRSEELKDIFAEAIELPPDQRTAFLDQRCAGDPDMRAAAEELLRAHERAGEFLAGPTLDPSPHAAPISTPTGSGAPPPPRHIGLYKLLQPIGEGGFGTVYLAEQERPVRRRVALKIIKLGMDTAAVIARFEAERQALAMMDHPNIARVFDAGATETGRPYFVMELVNGVPVTEYCDANRLSVRQRLELFVPICQAVQHAHQKGIIHRDLKPSNVLVTLHDGTPVPKVIDFGIAKATQARLTEKTVFTEFRQMIGTPEYMSPEQAEISGLDIDTRSDVYSLGVLLYELLTGSTPFDARELRSKAYGEIQRMIREVEPPKPSTRLSSMGETRSSVAALRRIEPRKLDSVIRGELDWIVMRCLEKDRTRRYESASALAGDVLRYLADEPVSAGPPSALYRFRKTVRRHKVAFGAAAAIVAALAIGLAVAAYGLRRAVYERDQAIAARNAEAEAREYEQQTDRFLLDMFTSIDPAESRGRPVSVQDVLDKATQQIDANPPSHPIVEASLRYTFGTAYRSLGLIDQARKQLERAARLYESAKGANSISTAKAKMLLGNVLREQGHPQAAEPLLRDAVTVLTKQSGPEDAETLTAMSMLGDVLIAQNRHAEADPILTEEARRTIKVFGPDQPQAIQARVDLANLRAAQGKYADAEELFTQSLESSRRKQGEDHPDTLAIMCNLAELLRSEGKLRQAEPLLRDAYRLAQKVFGVDHPDTLVVEHNLALVLQPMGQLDESQKLFEDVLARRRRIIGENHPSTLLTQSNYGLLLQAQGKLAEAESVFIAVLERMRRVLGPDNPNTIIAENNIAWLKAQRGELDEAETMYRQIVPHLGRVMGDQHPYTTAARLRLGHVLTLQRKWTEAEPLLAAVWQSGNADGTAPNQAGYASAYGRCLAHVGKAKEALPLLTQADALIRGMPRPDATNLAKIAEAAVLASEQLGDQAQLAAWRQKLEAARAQIGTGAAPATTPTTQASLTLSPSIRGEGYSVR